MKKTSCILIILLSIFSASTVFAWPFDWGRAKVPNAVMTYDSDQNQVTIDPNTTLSVGKITIESWILDDVDNESANGKILTLTVDSGQSETGFGQPFFVNSTDGELENADADSSSTMPAIGISIETGTGAVKILLNGYARDDNWSWTKGGLIYVDTDPNNGTSGLTQTAPSGSGDQVQVIGQCFDDPNILWISPEKVTVEIE